MGVALLTYPQSNSLKLSQIDKEAVFADKTYASFEKLAKEKGIEVAYSLLKEKFPANQAAAHDFAHVVGLASFEKKGPSGLSVCDAAYNYGCYHGFIEGFLVKKGPEAIVEIEKSCLALGSVHAPSCIHGIGHGVLAYRSYKLDEALMDCDVQKENTRIYCWDGVFMERITGSMQNPKDRPILTETTLNQPCDSIAYIYKKNCWRNQVAAWFIYFQNNPQKVGARCSLIEPEFQEVCFENIGFTNVMSAAENRDLLIGWCQIENGRISDSCIIGEMKELLFEGKSPQLAQSLCIIISPQKQQDCHQQFQLHFAEYQTRFGQKPQN
ncbi:hypothetical protein HYW39_00655 [Candidatus Curtissbacteria bacterium]|nr:hypothetical protein [Candidatus Curtissbacteria bacterium]